MSDQRPVLLLPGHQSADAADEYFSHAYECASWHDDQGQPYSNGQLAAYAGRRVDVWGAPRNKVDATAVLDELKRLECQVRYIDLTSYALEPYAAFIAQMTQAQVLEFARQHIKPYEPAKPEPKSNLIPIDERRRIRWDQLDGKTPPERQWIVNHWLTHGPTLLAGQGGIGKTHLAQTIGTALALGRDYLDTVNGPKRVLFWACEDDHDELWRRQINICKYFDVNLRDAHDNLIIETRLGMQNGLLLPNYGAPTFTEVFKVLKEQVNDYQAEVLIVDNIGQCFGGNENDRHHVTAFLSGLMGLSEKPLAVLMLGHPAKSIGSEYSGSTAWEAAVRMRWYLGVRLPDQKDEADEEQGRDAMNSNIRFLCKRKANYTHLDYRQLTWSDGVYACEPPISTVSFRDKYASGARSAYARELVMTCVKQFFDAGVRVTASANSPDYVLNQMRAIKVCQDYTQSELREALTALRLEGRIIEAPVGKYGNRTKQVGLAPLGSI